MLPLAERYLQLRHDVPVGTRSCLKITVGQKLDLRRPDAAESSILGERFAHSRPPEGGSWGLSRVGRQFGSRLDLYETASRQQLSKCCERLKLRVTGAKLARFVS